RAATLFYCCSHVRLLIPVRKDTRKHLMGEIAIKSEHTLTVSLENSNSQRYTRQSWTNQGGGMLASIHSQEEHEFMQTLAESVNCGQGGEWYHGNVGLRCTGKQCAWDDGSPVTYTNFETGMEPIDDGKTRCYGLHEQIHTTCWS
ncbi:hypothetical protein PENTCL1PPCAC_29949, partial [Pristionchus entomophagus]